MQEIALLGGFVQKYYYPEIMLLGILVQGFFRVCAEILVFGEIFTSHPLLAS